MDRSTRPTTQPVLDTILYFFKPDIGFGLGLAAMLPAMLGMVLVLRSLWRSQSSPGSPRSPELVWSAVIFGIYAGILIVMGEAVVRFFAPTVPLGCVLAVHGLQVIGQRNLPVVRTPLLTGVLAGCIAVATCIPVRPPKVRMQRLASPQNVVREHRDTILRILGDKPLYTDTQFLAVTAILDHPVHAVYDQSKAPKEPEAFERFHPGGVSMDWDGKFPDSKREELPKGTLYLTYDPGGGEVLWQARDLYLVRWSP